MAPQPFAFPPPPPPPPPPTSASTPSFNSYSQFPSRGTDTRGRGRGLGGDRGYRGRGRGHERGRGNTLQHTTTFHPRGTHHSQPFNSSSSNHHPNGISKRPSLPKPAPSPAVPAFGAPLPTLFSSSLPPTHTPTADLTNTNTPTNTNTNPAKRKRKRKHNQLGLTPAGADYSSSSASEAGSDADAGEETRLAAHAAQTAQVLQFEYKGATATLRTPAEIAAWIAQRRARWPTAAKVDAHRAEQARRQAERDAAREQAFTARRQAQEERRARGEGSRGRGRGRGRGQIRGREQAGDGAQTELAKAEAALEAMRAKVLGLRKAAAADEGESAAKTSRGEEGELEAVDREGDDSSVLGSSSSDESSLVLSSSDDNDNEEDEEVEEADKQPAPDQDGTKADANKDDDSSSDAPPDELARGSAAARVRMPASRSAQANPKPNTTPKTEPAQASKRTASTQPTCHLWMHAGRCPLRTSGCRGAHPFKARGSVTAQSMTLRARLEEREREDVAERVLAAVRSLGDAGFFAGSAEEGSDVKE